MTASMIEPIAIEELARCGLCNENRAVERLEVTLKNNATFHVNACFECGQDLKDIVSRNQEMRVRK